jgi:hypothetical protein
VAEPEALLHHAGQIAIEDTEDDRHLFPAVSERLPYGQPVSMLVRSALVSTATADGVVRLTMRCVWSCVASAITTGTPRPGPGPGSGCCRRVR